MSSRIHSIWTVIGLISLKTGLLGTRFAVSPWPIRRSKFPKAQVMAVFSQDSNHNLLVTHKPPTLILLHISQTVRGDPVVFVSLHWGWHWESGWTCPRTTIEWLWALARTWMWPFLQSSRAACFMGNNFQWPSNDCARWQNKPAELWEHRDMWQMFPKTKDGIRLVQLSKETKSRFFGFFITTVRPNWTIRTAAPTLPKHHEMRMWNQWQQKILIFLTCTDWRMEGWMDGRTEKGEGVKRSYLLTHTSAM